MRKEESFEPQWASPPGNTILAALERSGLSLEELAEILEVDADGIVDGRLRIGAEVAGNLARYLGGSERFWINRERQYREDATRRRLLFEATEQEWLDELPLDEMSKLGWLGKIRGATTPLPAVLEYFGSRSISEWRQRYSGLISAVSFRTSPIFGAHMGAVIAWLRQGEIQSKGIDLGEWDREGLRQAVPSMRALARSKPPAKFFPELREICARFGVALCVAKAPTGCRASGATWFAQDGTAICLLSFRYGHDDQFWFTFFHEIGHLILHSDRGMFLEDGDPVMSDEESEANAFSQDVLIPQIFRQDLAKVPNTHLSVASYARKIKISPGIVVGQMQHLGLLPHGWLARLKKKYDWSFVSSL
jgi:HTH-type transcriptional regulator/antitoxin HigA